MSSYFPSFAYTAPNGVKYDSYKDKHLVVVHFESGDSGEMDTFLGMTPIYTDNAYGTRRLDYGAKYNNVAVIRISVMKANGTDFTLAEVRDFLRWTTGSRTTSFLDLMDGEIVKASFLGRITAVYQQKLDARTVGFVIEHTSVSPYAYSPIQYAFCHFKQKLMLDDNGVLFKNEQDLDLDNSGILSGGSEDVFDITNDGVLYLLSSVDFEITNYTDDLSDYVYVDATFNNINSDRLIIKNKTLYEESNGTEGVTDIAGVHDNEVVTLCSRQFITSSSGRSFGNNFNFVWPKLLPGVNNFVVSGNGDGSVEFAYRYPIKIGDCAMDISVSDDGFGCDCPCDSNSEPVTWDDIIGKPSTIGGYGITDAYTITEINNQFNNIDVNIDGDDLNDMLEDVLE